MTILYNSKPNPESDNTEGHIKYALEKLGHTVVTEGNADLYLFHKTFNPPKDFTGKKVMWYFDKVWNGRASYINEVLPLIDLALLTDETWVNKQKNPKLRVLRQGIGEEDACYADKLRVPEIVFCGSVYGERTAWVKALKERYGDEFTVVNNKFNKGLYDLCASAKIIVAPQYPSDDHYWSNRIYLILGSGGFLIHPRLSGLFSEYEEGKHYVGYESLDELFFKIDTFLNNKDARKKIKVAGQEKTHKDYTYTKRCQTLLEHVNIGTSGH